MTLLDMVRQRRMELQAQELGPITHEDRVRAIRMCIANAPQDPAAAETLRKVRAIAPDVAAWVDELEAEMQGEAKARPKTSS